MAIHGIKFMIMMPLVFVYVLNWVLQGKIYDIISKLLIPLAAGFVARISVKLYIVASITFYPKN